MHIEKSKTTIKQCCDRHKFLVGKLSFILFGVIAIIFFAFPTKAHTNPQYTVSTESDLRSAVTASVGTGSTTTIALAADISLTGSLFTIPNNTDIILKTASSLSHPAKLYGATGFSPVSDPGYSTINVNGKLTLEDVIVTHHVGATGSGMHGVYVGSTGTFIMNDGEITGNHASGTGVINGYGAGVHVRFGTFIMNGGKIHNNSASVNGGGVITAAPGSFTMNDGLIYNNVATSNAGGVYNDGVFTMNGGTISGNRAVNGGAIWNNSVRIFTMNGGTITENTATNLGGGVANALTSTTGHFNMLGGTISKNTAANGGGVFSQYRFTMDGGTVDSNKAIAGGGGGGGIYCFNFICNINNSVVSNNQAAYGGGITYGDSVTTPTISGNTQIINNAATADGGAIWINQSKLSGLYIGSEVTFSGNSAQTAYLINPADIPMHNANILTTKFSGPFIRPDNNYAYNNHDIAYWSEDLVYVVSFDTAGGSEIIAVVVNPDDVVQEPTPPVREGYMFIGWYIDSDYTTTYDFSLPVNDDMTLYAAWEATSSPPIPEPEPESEPIPPSELPGSGLGVNQLDRGKIISIIFPIFLATVVLLVFVIRGKIQTTK